MRVKWIVAGAVVLGGAAGGWYYWSSQPTIVANQPTWERTFGGTGRDEASRAIPTSDGGVVLAGEVTPQGKTTADAWVVRLDKDGNTLWERTWGTAGDEHVRDVQASQDGGYIVTGETEGATSGVGAVWVAKLDGMGRTAWLHPYEKKRQGTPHAVLATPDGGYVVAGTEQSDNPAYYDGWVAKVDANGQVVWERFYGGKDDDRIYAIRETPDGGYIAAGTTQSKGAGEADAWVLKLSNIGEVQWEKTYGTAKAEAALDIVTLADKGYVLAGWSDADLDRHKRDGWVLRLDAKGDKVWEHLYGGREDDEARTIRPTNDGGYVLAGITSSRTAGGTDAWVVRLDGQGNVIWDRSLGGSDDDGATSVVPMLDGAFVVAGSTASKGAGNRDAWAMRLNGLGELKKAP